MDRLDDDADPRGLEDPVDRVRDLLGQPFLNLKPPGVHLHDPRQLRQADDAAVGNVRDVRATKEWKQMVLAQAVQLDVAHHDHVLMLFVEERIADDIFHSLAIATRQPAQGLGDAERRLDDSLTIGILAEELELSPNQRLKLAQSLAITYGRFRTNRVGLFCSLACFGALHHGRSRSLGQRECSVDALRTNSYLRAMLLVGLTGNIASGKSTVAQMLSARGATIIDADVLARQAVEIGAPAYQRIVDRWGSAVLGPDQRINRAALRTLVFSNPDELEQLNAIVHPEVERMRDELLAEARARGDRIVVADIPLLFERHLGDNFDRIVLVDAPRTVRLERLQRERGLGEQEALDMIKAQMPAELKRARADIVIDNDGSLANLEHQVASAWSALVQAERETAGVA